MTKNLIVYFSIIIFTQFVITENTKQFKANSSPDKLADYLILSTESETKQKAYDITVVTTGKIHHRKNKGCGSNSRMVSVWINVTVIISINIVPLCRVWLVLRFVNICTAVSRLSRYVTRPLLRSTQPGQPL